MQNRRIIDRRLADAGVHAAPVLESNSMIVLMSHVQTGQWASILPAVMASTLLSSGEAMVPIASVPIRDTQPAPVIGLVYPLKDPLLPLTEALVAETQRLLSDPATV